MAGVRIDDLPTTVLPSQDHEFPAMKDGVSVRLKVGQVSALIEGILGPEITKCLRYVRALGAAEDLNTIKEPGIYTQNQNAGASGGANYPVANAGMLEVLDGGGATNVQTVQRYTEYSQPPIAWQRMRRNAGNWSAWDKIISQSSLPPVTPPANKRIYTSSDTWAKPTGLTKVVVTLLGGGGGGGGGSNGTGSTHRAGGEGGGGGATVAEIEAASLASTVPIIVGAGGDGGGVSVDGSGGGTSSFGSHCSASGGGGGERGVSSATSSGGAGGIGVGGFLNIVGHSGANQTGQTVDLSMAGGEPALFSTSRGADRGAGGVPGRSNQSGDAGKPGLVIVEEYF